MFLAFYL